MAQMKSLNEGLTGDDDDAAQVSSCGDVDVA